MLEGRGAREQARFERPGGRVASARAAASNVRPMSEQPGADTDDQFEGGTVAGGTGDGRTGDGAEEAAGAWFEENWDPSRPLGEWWQRLADSAWCSPSWPRR